jgi:NADPH:quinone reductase-like Zn-dependent oxidoreductase
MVKSLGADHIVDYTRENFLEKAQRYDLVFDAVDKLPQRDAKKVLKPDGKYLNVARDSGSPEDLRVENLQFLTELIEAGELSVAVDRAYPLEDIVAAHRYVDQGHKKGNVVIRVSPEGEC